MDRSRAPGLRLQILLALGGLMVLAFVPLFVAVASVTGATLREAHERAAWSFGHAIAAEVGAATRAHEQDPGPVLRRLTGRAGTGFAIAIVVVSPTGAVVAKAGDDDAIARLAEHARADGAPGTRAESATRVHVRAGNAIDLAVPDGDQTILLRLLTGEERGRETPLVRLVALYMITFALALLTFAYFALTRLIVRPVDALVQAADNVATGARTLPLPATGARELVALSSSLQAMTARLLSDEATLRAKVEELTETTTRLGEARSQLAVRDRLATVGQLAAGIAHEIGNPIAALLGMEDLLLEGDLPEPAVHDFLVRMKKETERIHAVIRDLLDFARPEEARDAGGADDDEPLPASVAEVTDDLQALLAPQKSFKGITLVRDLDPPTLRVALAAPRLTQVLLNLVLNAASAIATRGLRPDDRVTVRARRVPGQAIAGARVCIAVEDTGPGIDPKLGDRIFEPFVTSKGVGEGTGLGLAVCRGLVEAAGGVLRIDPSYQGGARLEIELPAPSRRDP